MDSKQLSPAFILGTRSNGIKMCVVQGRSMTLERAKGSLEAQEEGLKVGVQNLRKTVQRTTSVLQARVTQHEVELDQRSGHQI